MRLPILKISQNNTQKHFWNFLTLWKHFHNLIIFRGYPCNIFHTEIREMFLEYSGNITLWLLEFSKRLTSYIIYVIIKSYTFNTKATFPLRIFQKIFSFKVFPKRWRNTQRIFPEYYVPPGSHSEYYLWKVEIKD